MDEGVPERTRRLGVPARLIRWRHLLPRRRTSHDSLNLKARRSDEMTPSSLHEQEPLRDRTRDHYGHGGASRHEGLALPSAAGFQLGLVTNETAPAGRSVTHADLWAKSSSPPPRATASPQTPRSLTWALCVEYSEAGFVSTAHGPDGRVGHPLALDPVAPRLIRCRDVSKR